MSPEQKIALGILSVCGILIVSLSAQRLLANIRDPFLVPNTALEYARAFAAAQLAEANKLADLQKKDTDRDGLSDYVEVQVYKTSPYLADSDSDGVPDSVEIAQGEDPNCPRGKECFSTESVVIQPSVSSSLSDLKDVTEVPRGASDVQLGASSTVGVANFLENPPRPEEMTPPKIREFLVKNGLTTQQQISQLDDSMIVQLYAAAYQEALRVQAASQSKTSPSSP